MLADPTYRCSAERMRDEIAALPGPEYAVQLLERLAIEKLAIIAPCVEETAPDVTG